MRRVVVGISGGVDSSVAAWKLKEEGYDVVALFMRNWHDTTGLLRSKCHWEDDLMFADMTAKKLGIPLHFVDLSDQYKKRVVNYMFAEYEKGRTPNPDILCNREIKFDLFADEARKLGGDFVATGHYCRKRTDFKENRPVHRLLAGVDKNKDQSYFLCQLSQEQLAYALFPIGELTKPDVRRIAAEQQLATAQRKDSQGICFIGKVDLPTFLQQKLKVNEGETIKIPAEAESPAMLEGLPDNDITEERLKELTAPVNYKKEEGKVVGKHKGAHFYTIGQRKGINIGGCKEPLFVLETDVKNNILFVGEGHSHPGLNRKGLYICEDEIHYVSTDKEMGNGESRDFLVRIRYRQPLQEARLFKRSNGMYIIFAEAQRGITPGQFAAWYDGEELVGSGVISSGFNQR